MKPLNIDTNKLLEEINIEAIAKQKLEDLVNRKLDDFFSGYGDFGKALETKIKAESDINLEKIQMPMLGNFVIDAVEQTIKKYADKQKEEITLKALKTISKALKKDEIVTCKELEDNFALEVWSEIEHHIDACPRPEIYTMDELAEFREYDDDLDIEVSFTDRITSYSTFEIVRPELQLSATYEGTHIFTILFHLRREVNKGEAFKEQEKFKEGANNIYKIEEVILKEGKDKTYRFNEKSILIDGNHTLNSFNLQYTTAMINGAKIDMNKVEICEKYEEVEYA